MRPYIGIVLAALSGTVTSASQPSADVFILQSNQQSSTETPRVPKEVARHVLLQRTTRDRYGSDLRDIPHTIDLENAIEYIARYGKSPAPLFAQKATTEASQLVVILEGVTAENAGPLKKSLARSSQQPAFAISDPPSSTANNRLMSHLRALGVSTPSSSQCDLASVMNPFDNACWDGPSAAVRFDLQKDPETINVLLDNLSRLEKFVSNGELEAIFVLMPESSRTSKVNHWSSIAAGASSELRHRGDSETVIADDFGRPTKAPVSHVGTPHVWAQTGAKAIPQCFNTFNSCMTQTGNCSGHGECANKYGKNATSHCFSCVCMATVVRRGDEPGSRGRKTVHWGGSMCQKEDVSVPFWLITGFTIAIVGAVSFSIGLLFSVGEEKLPGVIGAGVSRSK
ncbi:hypothetical protein QBC46DRAFT_294157 [Diplogelasinospora grovesii]|uniref:DUF3844 domain-containing protein n=1 Tax=Diplogelasinospora grovesii TaxID=303347 RepID=A0AAN6N491_9PEZI|nr:hypothetical protein QBC46DRAFT_294157 [Diplogelasinospora grovesii]